MLANVTPPNRTSRPERPGRASGRSLGWGSVAVVAVAITTVIATNAQTAGASAAGRTPSFQAEATSQLTTGSHSFVLAEQDVVGSTVVGHDVLSCVATRIHSTCDVAFAQSGGLLYAHFVLRDSDRSIVGTISGGTARYAHARGTINGKALSPTAVRVTLHYSLGASS